MSATTISAPELESTLRVLQTIYEHEGDHDHKHSLRSAMAVLVKQYNGDAIGAVTPAPDEDDVETALDVLDRHGEEYGGLDDTWTAENDLNSALEFVDLAAQHTNRPLPEPRDWEIKYIHADSGTELETRSMEYSDSEPTVPLIDDTPYDCDRTTWRDQTFIVYVREATPDPGAFELSCWDCSFEETADTAAEAQSLASEHNEQNPNHNAGYSRNHD